MQMVEKGNLDTISVKTQTNVQLSENVVLIIVASDGP